MKTFSGRRASQREDELIPFIAYLQRMGCRSYLEIGARHGDTFHAVMDSLPLQSYGVAVDLPDGAWGQPGTAIALGRACDDLRDRGYNVHMALGDCADRALMDWVDLHSSAGGRQQFDACLIDADHRYDAVMRDFKNYSPMARLVALHDIVGEGVLQKSSGLPVEVPRAWAEIKQLGRPTIEIIGAARGMGIGLVLMDYSLVPLFGDLVEVCA